MRFESEAESLKRRLAEAKENLRLIRERKSEFVQQTNIPLELIKDERRLEQEIKALQAQLAQLPPPQEGMPPSPARSHVWAIVAGVVGLVLVLTVGVALVVFPPGPSPPVGPSSTPPFPVATTSPSSATTTPLPPLDTSTATSPPITPTGVGIVVEGRIAFTRYPEGEPSKMELCIWKAGEVNPLRVGGVGADWSPDGEFIAFVAGEPSCMYRMTSDGGSLEAISGEQRPNARYPAWSPDGEWLAFTALPEVGAAPGTDDVFIVNREGEEERRMTTNPQLDTMPDWSPRLDRPQLVFVSWYKGRQGIYTVDVDAPQPEETRHLVWEVEGAIVDLPTWAPNGETIAFLHRPGPTAQICLVAADGHGDPICHQVKAEHLGLAWSPGGEMLAYIAIERERWGIYVLDVNSGEHRLLVDQPDHKLFGSLSWSR